MAQEAPPDPFEEFGVTLDVMLLIPADFYPPGQDLIRRILAQFRGPLFPGSRRQTGPHWTALRNLIGCWAELDLHAQWVRINLPGQTAGATIGHVNNNMGLNLRRLLWFHWACINFGDQEVISFVISFSTWITTPAPYRPQNAPILSHMVSTASVSNLFGNRPGSSGPRRRSPSPRRLSRSPSPSRRK
uniref:Core protein n=1 Tax=Hepatitis B virus TaxID=10407 RepID=A0A8F3CIP3_HBV|nr:MAG: core protein [Hepatitis B virus]